MGFLTTAAALPGLLLGSFLETNEFPDLAALTSKPANAQTLATQSPAVLAGVSTDGWSRSAQIVSHLSHQAVESSPNEAGCMACHGVFAMSY